MDLLKSPYTPTQLALVDEMRSRLNVARAVLMTRLDQGLSQDEVGRLAGTKQSRISELEASKGNVRFDTLDRIARVLGLMVDLVPRRRADAAIHFGGYSILVETKNSETTASPPVWRSRSDHGAVLVGST
jgi:transcriptional regulator with XRE-family HTH domain